MFATVGGNNEAKLALEDALALDPRKRRILSNFGLSPPIGVLLYGPPGETLRFILCLTFCTFNCDLSLCVCVQ